MEKLYEIKESIHRAIDKTDTVKGGELKMGELEFLRMATDTIKNIDKICMLEEEGYSEDGYGGGSSYANRGQHYVRGHYSRDGGRDGGRDGMGGYSSRRDSRGRYSRDDGRSKMMEHLEAAMDTATEEDRENIKRFMRQMENA